MSNEVVNKTQRDHVIYSRDVIHSYSKGIGKLLDLCLDYIPYCKRAYEEGKRVIWNLGMSTDCVLTYSMGAIPASITEIGRLGSDDAVVTAEQYFQVPNETCAMVKADLGEFFLQRGTIANRIYYTSKICEPYNMAFQLLEDYGYDIHVVDVGFPPYANASDERKQNNRDHYHNELIKLIDWFGYEFDEEKLKQEEIRYNKIQRKIQTILNLRAYHPTYLGSLPTMLMLMANGHYFGKPEEYEEALDLIINELSALKPDEYNDQKVIIGWSGARGQEFNIFEAIDEAGGAVLMWSIPNDTVRLFDTSKSGIEAYENFELGDLMSLTTQQLSDVIIGQMKRFNAKGLLLYGYLGCSFATIDIELKRRYFQEKNIPSLSLIGSFDVGNVTGQVTTRVKAFIELLAKEEEERKKAV